MRITSRKLKDYILRSLTWLFAVLTFAMLFYIIIHILTKGVPHIKPSLFALEYTADNVSLFPAL